MPKELATTPPDVLVATIAGRQHGVVATYQLEAVGLLPSGISDRTRAGRLHRIHRGVYAVGHSRLSNEGRWMAAVLAYGAGAVLSYHSAGALWRIIRNPDGRVDVSVPGNCGRSRRQGIRVYRSSTLTPADCATRDGIPVTRPSRTLDDLRRVLPSQKFAAALREAEFLRLPIGQRQQVDRARTDLEAMFLALCRRHRLPQPWMNVKVERFEVDFLWPARRLVVEVDDWESHRTRSAFEEDRRRDARLKLLGYEVLRFTRRQVKDEARTVAATIRMLLRR
jgi:very-short-patch-repair endonuclease